MPGAAISQGVLHVAEKLIVNYTKIKRRAKRLAGGGDKTSRGAGGGQGEVDAKVEEEGDGDWDLSLTLRTAEYNGAKMERLRLSGNR